MGGLLPLLGRTCAESHPLCHFNRLGDRPALDSPLYSRLHEFPLAAHVPHLRATPHDRDHPGAVDQIAPDMHGFCAKSTK